MPVQHLGSYLRDFDQLLIDHGLDELPYGHFGDGCVHVRIDYDRGGRSSGYRAFVEEAASWLPAMAARCRASTATVERGPTAPGDVLPAALAAFGQVKAAFDPENLLNPGVLVDPRQWTLTCGP